MFYVMIRYLAVILLKIFFRLRIFGRKNIPLQGGFILAGNHKSYLDPPVLGAACPRVLYFMAKRQLFRHVLFRWLISRLNAFPLDVQRANLSSIRLAVQKLRAGHGLTIFPEGTRIAADSLGEPLRGIGLISSKARVPIVPVYIQGSEQALPVGSRLVRPRKIRVFFGRPIYPQEITGRQKGSALYQAIARRTMQGISRLKTMAESKNPRKR